MIIPVTHADKQMMDTFLDKAWHEFTNALHHGRDDEAIARMADIETRMFQFRESAKGDRVITQIHGKQVDSHAFKDLDHMRAEKCEEWLKKASKEAFN